MEINHYTDFLNSKIKNKFERGIEIEESELNSMMFDFQKKIVKWSLLRKKSAIFADCGLGKTIMQLEWARIISNRTNGKVLILSPLAVAKQTELESKKFNIEGVKYCRSPLEILDNNIILINYEMMDSFDSNIFNGVVLDESSILKGFDGKTKQKLINNFQNTEYKLCCTATASPNDLVEIVNHSEFLGYMKEKEAKATFFIQDGNSSNKWRLKKHSVNSFWEWISSWAVALRTPSDIGFDDNGFKLPELNIENIVIKTGKSYFGKRNFIQRRDAKKITIKERTEKCLELINNNPDESWIVWCDLNSEADELKKIIPNSVEIRGSDSLNSKESAFIGFSNGDIKRLITKPSIAGFGLNWQHCHNVIFIGLSDSYEKYYQAIRRVWRFGQQNQVKVFVISTNLEIDVLTNIKRKEKETKLFYNKIIKNFNFNNNVKKEFNKMENNFLETKNWKIYQGDSIELIDKIETESVDFSIFSPPFPAMYVYTDSISDLGNSASMEQMIQHFSFLVEKEKLFRIIKPGRNVCIHLTQTPTFKSYDGYIGMKDFRGEVIRLMQSYGWIYYSEVTINKNPQIKAIRTRDATLSFRDLVSDSANSRPAMADYLLIFKKPGKNNNPVHSGSIRKYDSDGWINDIEWIEWAHPVWNDIIETDTLNYRNGRDSSDEKHLCPLQLSVIERCVKLYTNPNEIVFSPFMGIGSEGYESLLLGRKFIGIELKNSYFDQSNINLKLADKKFGSKHIIHNLKKDKNLNNFFK